MTNEMKTDATPHEPSDQLVIPRWFVYVISGLAALAVPWASWVSMTLATLQVRLENTSSTDQRVKAIAAQQVEISHRIGEFSAHLQHLQRDIERAENRP